eukprot:Ihof_evm9s41 gene=Ihof_evmTU9s41
MPKLASSPSVKLSSRELASPPLVYTDDYVRSNIPTVRNGVVVRTRLDDLEESSDEEGESEVIPAGMVRVAWLPTQEEENIPETEVEVLERCLLKGDIIKRTSDRGTLGATYQPLVSPQSYARALLIRIVQSGMITNIKVCLDLVAINDPSVKLYNVDALCVRTLRTYPNFHVAFGKRGLGCRGEGVQVTGWVEGVVVECPNGARALLGISSDQSPFRASGPLTTHMRLEAEPYPGEKVQMLVDAFRHCLLSWLTPERFIPCGKKINLSIVSIEVLIVHLKVLVHDGGKVEGVMNGDRLTLMADHMHEMKLVATPLDATLQIGSTIKIAIPNVNLATHEPADLPHITRGQLGSRKINETDFTVFLIEGKHTRCDILWQDGTVEPDMPSTALRPFYYNDDMFFPGDYVTMPSDDSTKPDDRLGVVWKCENSTCLVYWMEDTCTAEKDYMQDLDFARGIDLLLEAAETYKLKVAKYSVYDLTSHPDYHFALNDVVIRMGSDVIPGQSNGDAFDTIDTMDDARWVGQVHSHMADGSLCITWLDDTMTCVAPTAVYKVEEDNDYEANDHEVGEEGSDADWVTDDSEREEADDWVDVEDEGEKADNGSPITTSQQPLLVHRARATCTESKGSTIMSPPTDNEGHDIPEGSEVTTLPRHKGESTRAQFPSFLVLERTPSTVHYLSLATPSAPLAPQFISVLRKEYKLLTSCLPEGIQIRTYEDHIELFSVLIFGPDDTPYKGNVFVFDLQLPPTYPSVPPNAYYHSRCTGKLNPNLYEDGKICLSLLGTWAGKGAEVWGPHSNLLQLVVSLQALVLTKDPYYNEAGYERQRGMNDANESSRQYNESVVLRSLQAMESWARHPAEAFHHEILTHFSNN